VAFDWIVELLVLLAQTLRLEWRRRQSRGWPLAAGTVQRCCVMPRTFKSVFGYAFAANGSTYAGFFALPTQNPDEADALQKHATGTAVMVRYNPQNPDVSILEERTILGRRVTQNPHWLP